jgi:hypothetical protein|tara:strand:+ start:750 stop:935 length:186 start_codon:yes stop_codon:yes gene_type:complete
MNNNFWEKEKRYLFKNLLKQYKEEGYDMEEAKQLAKLEANEIMEDKEDFVANLWKETYEDD